MSADQRFITSSWHTVGLFLELVEVLKKKHPTTTDRLYELTLRDRLTSSLHAMRVSTPTEFGGQVVRHDPSQPQQEPVEVVVFRKPRARSHPHP